MRFTHRTVIITPAGATPALRAFGANALRRSFIVSSPDTSGNVVWIYSIPSNTTNRSWFHFTSPGGWVFPYRDYGTLVTGEILIGYTGGGSDISVTEVLQLPTGD